MSTSASNFASKVSPYVLVSKSSYYSWIDRNYSFGKRAKFAVAFQVLDCGDGRWEHGFEVHHSDTPVLERVVHVLPHISQSLLECRYLLSLCNDPSFQLSFGGTSESAEDGLGSRAIGVLGLFGDRRTNMKPLDERCDLTEKFRENSIYISILADVFLVIIGST